MRSIVLLPTPAAFFLAVALLMAGCTPAGDDAASEQDAPGGSRFGNDYEIVVSETPAAPDQPPALSGDSLVATVGYAGGCETHDFALRHEARADTSRLWLAHDAHGDDCAEHVLDDVQMKIPAEALQVPTVVLLNPQGGEPFVLRWDGEAGSGF